MGTLARDDGLYRYEFERSYSRCVADHRIELTLPTVELGRRDVVFAVFIDGEKQGELHVSEGAVDWWPRKASKRTFTKSWTELRHFMES